MPTRPRILATPGVISDREFEKLIRLSAEYFKTRRPRLLRAVRPTPKATTRVA